MVIKPSSLASVLALWLLTGPVATVLSQVTTPSAGASTGSAPASTSTFLSPSIRRPKPGELSESAKVGISVGVTLASIILVGSIAVLCIIWRRRRALTRPETRLSGDIEDEDATIGNGDNYGKGKDVGYMTPATTMTATNHGAPIQAPDGFISGGNGYPTTPGRAYMSQPYPQTTAYPTAQSGTTYSYSDTAYSGTMVTDPSQQSGYPGPFNTEYRTDLHSHMQQQQQQQQQIYSNPAMMDPNQQNGYAGSSIPQQYQPQPHSQLPKQSPVSPQQGYPMNWMYPMSTLPEVVTPMQDFQHMFLQDYQKQQSQESSTDRSTSLRQYQNGSGPDQIPASQIHQDGTGASYYVPPPRPDASELPDQRRPVELVGEGHYKEAP